MSIVLAKNNLYIITGVNLGAGCRCCITLHTSVVLYTSFNKDEAENKYQQILIDDFIDFIDNNGLEISEICWKTKFKSIEFKTNFKSLFVDNVKYDDLYDDGNYEIILEKLRQTLKNIKNNDELYNSIDEFECESGLCFSNDDPDCQCGGVFSSMPSFNTITM